MARQRIKRSLRWRLERLEAELRLHAEPYLRIGLLRQLPADYTGERHIAIAQHGAVERGRQSCSFEERPGPAPPGPPDPVPWFYVTETQMRIIGDPIEECDDAGTPDEG
jgi:hypothetical protein